jgi:hypothetical protein
LVMMLLPSPRTGERVSLPRNAADQPDGELLARLWLRLL